MNNPLKNETVQHQIAQGFIVASVIGAVILLGVSCAPVTNSVSKFPNRSSPKLNDESAFGKSFVSDSTSRIVSESEYAQATSAIPEGFQSYSVTEKQLADLQSQGSTLIRLEASLPIEVQAVLELSLPSEKIEERNLRSVNLHWFTVNPRISFQAEAVEFYVLLSEKNSNKSIPQVMKHLKSLSIYYREVK